MPTGRLTMRRIRDVLRLRFAQGLSERAIATSLGLGKGSVGAYLRRAREAGLGWPLPDGLDDDSLELLLFPASPTVPDPDRPVPDWAAMDTELRKPGVTRMLLWQEYRANHPGGLRAFASAALSTQSEQADGRRAVSDPAHYRRRTSSMLIMSCPLIWISKPAAQLT
jgi:hypothetical protein